MEFDVRLPAHSPRNLRVRVYDPKRLITDGHHDALEKIIGYDILRERLVFLQRRFSKRGMRARVVLQHWSTAWRDESRAETDPDASAIDILFEGDSLAETPEMALVGVVSQMFFEELKGLFPDSWYELMDEQVRVARADGFGDWTEEHLRDEIGEILRLRTTWYSKHAFYAGVKERRVAQFTDPWMELLYNVEQTQGNDAFDRRARESFTHFYGFNPSLVDRLWKLPLPGRWELAYVAPPLAWADR